MRGGPDLGDVVRSADRTRPSRTARVGRAIRRHPLRYGFASALLAALVVFVLLYFAPQDLILNTSVSQPLPVTTAAPTASTADATSKSEAPRVIEPSILRTGQLRSGEHATTGTVKLLQLADGRRYVRLEQLSTSNGPDVRIWLSRAASNASNSTVARSAYVDLGGLQANHGDQNYPIPAAADVSSYHTVVIWCRRFDVVFGIAQLQAP